MKKLLSVSIVILLVIALLCGCGNSKKEETAQGHQGRRQRYAPCRDP